MHHSTELAALEFVDRIITNLESRKPYISFFTDLSKAFDCLNHSILLHKLRHYGMQDKSLKLIETYLQNRKQYVELISTDTHSIQGPTSKNSKIKSELNTVNIGVPQGSIVGPLLFII